MIGVFLADGFEEIEALAVVDILRRAEINVKTISIKNTNSVTGSHKITVLADEIIDDIDLNGLDGYILPGGMPGTVNLGNCKKLCDALILANNNKKLVSAICAAPSVLGGLRILSGKKATCYPGYENKLIGADATGKRVEQNGNVITSKGAGTAHDFGFEIVKYVKGKDKADEIRASMQY